MCGARSALNKGSVIARLPAKCSIIWDDLCMQGRERADRQLLDAGALVGHLVPAGSMFAFLAAHRQELFGDEDFADLFPSGRGRPSVPASVMASVMVLQVLHDYSDAAAAGEVRPPAPDQRRGQEGDRGDGGFEGAAAPDSGLHDPV